MGRPRTLPDADELRSLLGKHTQIEIAAMYHVTRAAVSSAVRLYNLAPTRERYDAFIPWRVKVEHQRHYALRMLRLHARRTSGKPLDDQDERYLDVWLEKMSTGKLVVDYDPDEPDGFYYTQARPGVDAGLVRVPPWQIEGAKPSRRRASRAS